ncbi:preprotein translocase subunit SecA [Nocardia sp. CA2R105]|uniref:preprotein translocase subunit SecA n=1 Tax=Nocardia coffeae TaxID=2873381 RepID=UPI001CA65FEC|nr:preprotein translocase subunit SecA [Nocardia coffeae]MBY8862494.1 preprotein translocase subunit SecA [Nocardia coffeae]
MPALTLTRLLRFGEGRTVKRLSKLADEVLALEEEFADLSDAELQAKTDEFRDRLADDITDALDGVEDEEQQERVVERVKQDFLDQTLLEAFAVAREASSRVLNQKHYKVQVMGGAALHIGNVAEMKTGEGKTLTCVLPAYLNALVGDGVHVVTVNDYLAKRDSEWMGRVHRFLGLEVGVILSGMTPAERKEAYAADITYGTNNEFGFDYLRDNMTHSKDDLVQRGHSFAIVDEVDSILIDEARTPLIISGPADVTASKWYTEFARMAPEMKGIDTTAMTSQERQSRAAEIEGRYHYEFDLKKRTVGVSTTGVAYVEDQLGIDNLYEAANSPLISYLNNALKAKDLFVRDKDYIVRNGEVIIVDEFTGRILVGRRYNEGMHQAIEAKEGVEIQPENQTLATITLQNYFRLYDKLAGMTGTAETEAAELHQTYSLGVVPIPTNKPMVRKDQADLIYKTEEGKFSAVADDITERYEKGQPVLIGTTSVERSEYLSELLTKRGIPHNVLNAKFHEKEAEIVAEAGRPGAVTVATNMAGRGTDIVLGGNPDILADLLLRRQGLDPVETAQEYEAHWHSALEQVKQEVDEDAEAVREAGGLYVLGTERHESRRIDNQLRGRSGRQGDPGESRFYLSLGDELMRRFNGATLESIMTRLNLPDDVPIEAKMVSRAIKSAQTQVEQQNFEIRKNVLKYDEVMNQQRTIIYDERQRILGDEDMDGQVQEMITDVVTAYVNGATADGYVEDWDLDKLWTALKSLYPITLDYKDLTGENEHDEIGELGREELLDAVLDDAHSAYEQREKEIDDLVGEGSTRTLEHQVLLQVLDRKWREHLYEMDYLKEGIGLRAMAQRDPLVEYQREGYDMFSAMLEGLKEESVHYLFNAKFEFEAPQQPQGAAAIDQGLRSPVGALVDAPQTNGTAAPAPLRARGIDNSSPRGLSYSGPDEDGHAARRSDAQEYGTAEDTGMTRRERREAARSEGRADRGPKSKRRR